MTACLSCRDKSGFFEECVRLAILQRDHDGKVVTVKAGEKYLDSAGDTLVATDDGTPTYEFLYGGACAGCHFNGGRNCSLLGRSIF